MSIENTFHCDSSCSNLDFLGSIFKSPKIISHEEVEYNLTRALGGKLEILYSSVRGYFKKLW